MKALTNDGTDFILPDLTVLSATGLVILSFLTSATTASLDLVGSNTPRSLGSLPTSGNTYMQWFNWGLISDEIVCCANISTVDHRIFPSRLNIWRHPAGHIFVALPADVLRTIPIICAVFDLDTKTSALQHPSARVSWRRCRDKLC